MKLALTGSAAILALTATAGLAEMHGASETRSKMHSSTAMSAMSTEELAQAESDLIRSRDITGGAIYTTNQANDEGWNPEMNYSEVAPNWNQIGEIEDLVLTNDGKVTGIVAEVGGFLDIGDKHVVISVSDLSLVAVDDESYAYLTKYSEEELEEMQSVDEGFWN